MMPAPSDVLLGRFRIEAEIGSGGMGAVYSAKVLTTNERIALKVLKPEATLYSDALPRFMNEARATMRLKSPNVVRVIEVGTLEVGLPFIAMELLDGEDLATALAKRHALPITDAVDYLLQAASALAEAHDAGIVHRDLKPSNLFLQRGPSGPVVKVLDFGVSKVSGDLGAMAQGALTSTGSFLGSPAYCSPEQLKNAKDVDRRADVWSLGVILYETLTDKLPFDGKSLGEVFMQVLSAEYEPLKKHRPDVPDGLVQVVGRCLSRKREDRFADVGALARALAPFSSHPPHSARTEHPQSNPQMPVAPPSSGKALGGTMVMGNRPQGLSELLAQVPPPSSRHAPASAPAPVNVHAHGPASARAPMQPMPPQSTARPHPPNDNGKVILAVVIGFALLAAIGVLLVFRALRHH